MIQSGQLIQIIQIYLIHMLILYNELNLLHKLATKSHPERPERIIQTIKYLKQTKYASLICTSNQLREKIQIDDDKIQSITQKEIIKVHGKRYFEFIQGMWCQGLSKPEMFINVDTYYMKSTFLSAFEASKAMILSVEKHCSQPQEDIVCLIRPPGHHSGMKNQPHGFSFFNNVAIAANYFVQKTKKKAVIIDWDIHHGQGTQNIFYTRNDVLYISLHRFDNGTFFPHVKQSGTEFSGQKDGKGFNINICWNFPQLPKDQKRKPQQTVRDQQYLYCFQNIILPILKQYEFGAIFVSCGFDCAHGDPIGDSKITKDGFRLMSHLLKQFKKPMIVVLEGGYNIDTLKWGVEAVVDGLDKNYKPEEVIEPKFQELNDFAKKDIQSAIAEIKKYWKI